MAVRPACCGIVKGIEDGTAGVGGEKKDEAEEDDQDEEEAEEAAEEEEEDADGDAAEAAPWFLASSRWRLQC